MDSVGFLKRFKQVLPPNEGQKVIARLREDPLVWSSLQEEKFYEIAFKATANCSELWNPGFLSLLSLDLKEIASDLIRQPLQPLEASLCQRAIRAYEDILTNNQPPVDLSEAGLIALALRERYRLKNSWTGLGEEIFIKKDTRNRFEIWGTILSCTFAFTEAPFDLFKGLSPLEQVDYDGYLHLVIHILFSNALNDEGRTKLFSELLEFSTRAERISWYKALANAGHVFQAHELSKILSENDNLGDLVQNISRDNINIDPIVDQGVNKKISDLQQLAELYKFNDLEDLAITCLVKASEYTGTLQAQLISSLSEMESRSQDQSAALHSLEQANDLVPGSQITRAKLVNKLIQEKRSTEIIGFLEDYGEDPYSKLTAIRVACVNGNLPLAKKIYDDFLQGKSMIDNHQEQINASFLTDVADTFIEQHLYEQAGSLIKISLGVFPNDLNLLKLSSKTALLTGENDLAVKSSYLLMLLQPENADLKKQLAAIYEKVGDWQSAYEERKQIITASPAPSTCDLLQLAHCAIKIDKSHIATSICKGILANDPENTEANLILGEALTNLDTPDEAIGVLNQACLVSPEVPATWLKLAGAYRACKDTEKALETLKEAIQVIPDAPLIHLEIGKLLFEGGNYSDAVTHLKIAYTLDPTDLQAIYLLGSSLLELGHLQEADIVVNTGRRFHANNKNIDVLYGQIMLQQEQPVEAWTLLNDGLDNLTENIPATVAYGRATLLLIKDGVLTSSAEPLMVTNPKTEILLKPDLSKSISLLEHAILQDPNHIDARILLSELLYENRQYQQALDSFNETLKLAQAQDSAYNWKILYGQGKSLLGIGEVDRAIVLLREVTILRPDQFEVQKTLTEAYMQVDLHDDADEVAQLAYYQQPDDLRILVWYTLVQERLGKFDTALASINKAVRIAPERMDLLLILAEIKHLAREDEGSIEIVNRIIDSSQVDIDVLHKSAKLCMKMKNINTAISCLEKAALNSTDPNIQTDLIKVYEENHNYSAAIDVVRQLLVRTPHDLSLTVWAAQLYTKAGQYQEALNELQPVLNNAGADNDQANQIKNENSSDSTTSKSQEATSIPAIAYILASYLWRITNRSQAALEISQKGLIAHPENLDLLVIQAKLSYALMLESNPATVELIHDLLIEFSNNVNGLEGKVGILTELACISAETTLSKKDIATCKEIITIAEVWAGEIPQMVAIKSRIASTEKDFNTAISMLDKSITALDRMQSFQNNAIENIKNQVDAYWNPLSIAEAAFDLGKWQIALKYYQKAAELAPQETLPHLRFARALTICAEIQKKARKVMVKTHSPNFNELGYDPYELFSQAIMRLSSVISNVEIDRWKLRGTCIFNPDYQTALSLANFSKDASDKAAALSALDAAGLKKESAEVYNQFSEFPEVILEKAFTVFPEEPELSSSLAQDYNDRIKTDPLGIALVAFAEKDNPEISIKYLEQALEIWSDEPLWHKYAAQNFHKLGDLLSSIEHWKEANKIEPNNIDFITSLARAYTEIGEVNQTIACYEQATQKDPTNPDIWLALAESYRSNKNLTSALTCAEKAVEESIDKITAFTLSGQVAFELGQKETALRYAKAILGINPRDSGGIILLCQAMESMGYPAQALAFIEQAIVQKVDDFQCLIQRAHLIRLVHGSKKALPYYQELSTQYPDQIELLSPLAEIYSEMGEINESEAVCKESLRLDPNQATAHYLLGKLQHHEGQFEQAIHNLDEAIRLSPNLMDAYLELGCTYHDNKDHGMAIKTYRQATRVAPTDPRPYYYASMALKECKDYIGAEGMLRYASQLSPDDLNIRRQLAAIITLNLVHNPHEVSLNNEH